MSEPTPEAVDAAAKAIHRYDWEHQLSARSAQNKHHRGEAEAALSAAAPFLVREAQAQALEDAAEGLEPDPFDGTRASRATEVYRSAVRAVTTQLRARAAAIRDGDQ
jgi:hypothetical protein